MSEHYGKEEMNTQMQKHWSTWVTKDDFAQMAAAGLNMVRIPLGYWSVVPIEGDPFIDGAIKWFAQALDWADASGLKVLIDLHGAPGGQNGFDNSGQRDVINWTQGNTVAHTIKVLKKLRDDYGDHPAVAGIELLNEPFSYKIDLEKIKQFYEEGITMLRDGASANFAIVFHDAFREIDEWNDFHSGE